MSQMFHQLHNAVQNSKKVSWSAGLVMVGLITGTFLTGSMNNPTTLNAMTTDKSSVPSAMVPGLPPSSGFSEIARTVRPAIVHITLVQDMKSSLPDDPFKHFRDFWGEKDHFNLPIPPRDLPDPRGMGSGSGAIVSPDGYIVTNAHVVDGVKTVSVTLLDKREYEGKVIGTDPQTDIALVKIDEEDLPYLKWGDSSKLQIGDYVLAVGNPFGLTATVTQGIVSGMGRGGMGITKYEDFIQTDAAINPGNSGGALVNSKGELVGINTAIFSRTGGNQGIGFAVPAEMAQSVYASLASNGKVIRGFLGVGIQEITPDLAQSLELDEPAGALVTEVKPGSSAEEAGIQRGDAIVEYQGQSIRDSRALQKEVTRTKPGSSVSFMVMRDGHKQELQATLQEQSAAVQVAKTKEMSDETELAGVTVEPLNSATARRWGVTDTTHGVVVSDVKPNSPADRAGIARGDVIREVNKKEIHSVQEYKAAVESIRKDQQALMLIERSGVPLFLTMKA